MKCTTHVKEIIIVPSIDSCFYNFYFVNFQHVQKNNMKFAKVMVVVFTKLTNERPKHFQVSEVDEGTRG